MSENKEPVDQPEGRLERKEMSEAAIDRTLADTFPASDPPSWTLGTDRTPAPPSQQREAEDDSEAD